MTRKHLDHSNINHINNANGANEMGYYTDHELTVSDGHACDHMEGICTQAEYRGLFEEECKWYEHEKDMRAYSKIHPEVLFTLHGEGEESGDIWIEYYKNGLMQSCKAKVTFADFNELLLK